MKLTMYAVLTLALALTGCWKTKQCVDADGKSHPCITRTSDGGKK